MIDDIRIYYNWKIFIRKKETILINTVTLIITSAVLNTVTEEILPIKKHTRLNLTGLPSNTDYNDLGGGN